MLVLLSLTAARAGALGPGIPVAQVVPPPVLLEGVNTIDVVPFTGPQGEAIALDIEAAMARTDRIVEANGMAQVGTELVGMATETGAALASNLVGGGVQGKLVGGAAKLAGGLVAPVVAGQLLAVALPVERQRKRLLGLADRHDRIYFDCNWSSAFHASR